MGFSNRPLTAGGLAFVSCVVVACGSSAGNLLSPDEAGNLKQQLDVVAAQVANRQCAEAQSTIQSVRSALAGYTSLDTTLLRNLEQGMRQVAQLASTSCASSGPPSTPQTSTTHNQRTTTTTTTTPLPITTATSTATTPITTPTNTATTLTTNNGGAGLGNGEGNGHGNGNGNPHGNGIGNGNGEGNGNGQGNGNGGVGPGPGSGSGD
jgi:hypothetical protein